MAAAMIWVTISHAIAAFPMVEAVAPRFDHGETEENPRPVPNDNKISASEADTNAPPITAGQETPAEWASFLPGISDTMVGRSPIGVRTAGCIFSPSRLVNDVCESRSGCPSKLRLGGAHFRCLRKATPEPVRLSDGL